jgi:HK97 family phage major capsid protein
MTATADSLNPGAYNSTELKQTIENLGKSWNEFQHELPNMIKNHVDPLLKEKMDKLNEAMNDFDLKKKQIEDEIVLAKKLAEIKSAKSEPESVKEGRKEFLEFARKDSGQEKTRFSSFDEKKHAKSFSMGSDPDGGILVRPYLDNAILQLLQELTPMRSICGQITISSDTYRQVASIDNTDTSWTDDETAPSDNQPNSYENLEIVTGNLRVTIPVPENLLNDAFFDLETSIMQQSARKMVKAEGAAFISGDGIKKPRGILTYANGDDWGKVEQIPSGNASALTYTGLMNLVYSLLSFYTPNAKFLMNRTTINQVRLLTYGAAFPVPIWQPSLIPGQPSTISGYPVIYAPDMPTFAAAAKAIAFGDFSQGYLIVDRVGMTVLRDPFTRYPNVLFRFLKRVGGGLRDYRAIKIQTVSAS